MFSYCSLEEAFPQGLSAGDSINLFFISATFSLMGLMISLSLAVLGFAFCLLIFDVFFTLYQKVILKIINIIPVVRLKFRPVSDSGYYLRIKDVSGVFYIFLFMCFCITTIAILSWRLNLLELSLPTLLSGVIIYFVVSYYEFNKREISRGKIFAAKRKRIAENKSIIKFGPFFLIVMIVFLLAGPLSLAEKTFLTLGIRKENVTIYIKDDDAKFLIYKKVPHEKVKIGKDMYIKIAKTDVIMSSLGEKIILRTKLPERKFFQFSINNDKVIIDTEINILTHHSD